MSLEDQVAALVAAVEANTDAIQHLAAAFRSVPTPAQFSAAAPQERPAAEPKPRGRPKTAAAPGPDLASQGEQEPESDVPAAPLGNARTATSDPAGAQSAKPGSTKGEELTYSDLAAIVPQVAEKHGHSVAVGIFARMGFTSGKELAAKAPERIGEAVRLFREAL